MALPVDVCDILATTSGPEFWHGRIGPSPAASRGAWFGQAVTSILNGDTMERCPNCGAPARPGAKFCTTCGYRLPVTIPVTDQPEAAGQASSTAASSWPPPLQRDDAAASDQSGAAASSTDASEGTTETSFTIPVTSSDDDSSGEQSDTVAASVTETDTASVSDTTPEEASSTDSVVSSTWTASSSSSSWGSAQPEPAAADIASSSVDVSTEMDEVSVEQSSESGDTGATAAVTEESIVVDEPASQYEGWSRAVVEELAPPSSDHGTNVARATALLDELRMLLPVLNSGSSDVGERVANELEAALSGTREEGDDRASLRAALTEARDNPRDIQTILGLSQQADAAIALLDDYDRLVSAVRHAIRTLRPSPPGIYPSED